MGVLRYDGSDMLGDGETVAAVVRTDGVAALALVADSAGVVRKTLPVSLGGASATTAFSPPSGSSDAVRYKGSGGEGLPIAGGAAFDPGTGALFFAPKDDSGDPKAIMYRCAAGEEARDGGLVCQGRPNFGRVALFDGTLVTAKVDRAGVQFRGTPVDAWDDALRALFYPHGGVKTTANAGVGALWGNDACHGGATLAGPDPLVSGAGAVGALRSGVAGCGTLVFRVDVAGLGAVLPTAAGAAAADQGAGGCGAAAWGACACADGGGGLVLGENDKVVMKVMGDAAARQCGVVVDEPAPAPAPAPATPPPTTKAPTTAAPTEAPPTEEPTTRAPTAGPTRYVGIIPHCADNGDVQPCVPRLDGTARHTFRGALSPHWS